MLFSQRLRHQKKTFQKKYDTQRIFTIFLRIFDTVPSKEGSKTYAKIYIMKKRLLVFLCFCSVYTYFSFAENSNRETKSEADTESIMQLVSAEENKEKKIIYCAELSTYFADMSLHHLALKYSKEGIKAAESTKDEYRELLLKLYALKLEALANLNDKEELKTTANKFALLIEKGTSEKETSEARIKTDEYRLLYEYYYIRYYLSEGNATQVESHKQHAETLLPLVKNSKIISLYKQGITHYYIAENKTEEAYNILKTIPEKEMPSSMLMIKAEMLSKKGQTEEAKQIYKTIAEKANKDKATLAKNILSISNAYATEYAKAENYKNNPDNCNIENAFFLSVIIFLAILSITSTLYALRIKKAKQQLSLKHESILQTQKELEQAKSRAEESDRLKMLFLANMSHEIRTPLNAIVGFSSILTDKESDTLTNEERTTYGQLIEQNTETLLQLVNDVLSVSELEADGCRFNFAECELGGCCRMITSAAECKAAKGVRITFSPSDEPFTLYTDQSRLEQVFKNLLSNAIKFTKEGTINLSYNVDKENKEVRFAMTDTGIGIPLEKQAQVFGRFVKMDDYVPGTGLGLSICSLIVKRLGGRIYVDSNYSGGTRIVFTHKIFDTEEIQLKHEKDKSTNYFIHSHTLLRNENISFGTRLCINRKRIIVRKRQSKSHLLWTEKRDTTTRHQNKRRSSKS